MEEIKLDANVEMTEKSSNNKGLWIGIIGVAVIFIIIIAVVVGISGEGSSSSSYLTYSNYTRIQNNMTYSQVVEILGNDPGELTSTASSGGYTLSYYTWQNSSGSKCIVIGFENGKVCAKTQYGLK